MLISRAIIAIVFLLAGVCTRTHILAVPAPRDRVQPVPIVGEWDLTWGSHLQQSTFRADGTCDSPQFGAGTWRLGDDGSIWFTEQSGRARYAMAIDWDTLTGQGAWVCDDGELTGLVDVKLKRRMRAVE
jgi:hypothetical protein